MLNIHMLSRKHTHHWCMCARMLVSIMRNILPWSVRMYASYMYMYSYIYIYIATEIIEVR
jgi:hypothetical protein